MSLRRRLMLVLLALSAVGLLAAGVASVQLLRRSLIHQKDDQLLQLLEGGGRRAQGGPRRSPSTLDNPAQRSADDVVGTAVEQFTAAYDSTGKFLSFIGQVTPSDGGGANVSPARLLTRVGHPFTADALNGGAQYRVLVEALPVPGVLLNGPNAGAVATYRAVGLELADVDQTVGRFVRLELEIAGVVLVAIGLVAWLLVRLGLRPLDRITVTAAAIAEGDLTARVDTSHPATEVGRLGNSLNTMLGRIEAAFGERTRSEHRLRRFVGDASHELRTPLTSIRGYAELMRSGAITDDAGRATALSRIESEAARMGVLVEDLLLLARLDQGRPLERAPVELGAVVDGAVADARVADPGRDWSVHGTRPVTIVGDYQKLQQVLSNLLANARTHTPAATPVEVHLATTANEAVVAVRDHGPGIPPEDLDRVFERFARLDEGRARSQGGTGLGLSIVRSIVESHGGTVGAENDPGGGAVFTVRLPLSIQLATLAPPTLPPPPAA